MAIPMWLASIRRCSACGSRHERQFTTPSLFEYTDR
jgi:hypothetical protein